MPAISIVGVLVALPVITDPPGPYHAYVTFVFVDDAVSVVLLAPQGKLLVALLVKLGVDVFPVTVNCVVVEQLLTASVTTTTYTPAEVAVNDGVVTPPGFQL